MQGPLLTLLRQDLTHSRVLTPQVRRHLASTYELADDDVAPFLQEELPKLEEYRVELLFGPLFTPTLEDRARYSALVRAGGCSEPQINEAQESLLSDSLTCDLELPTGEHFPLPLADVLIERYVRLLYLGRAPDAELAQRIEQAVPSDDVDLALGALREEVWHDSAKRRWLTDFLDAVAPRRSFSMRKLEFLADLLRSQVRPRSEHLLEVVRTLLAERRAQLGQVGAAKPFFARHIEEWHGHERDQRRVDPAEFESREQLIVLLEDLVVDLEHMVAINGE